MGQIVIYRDTPIDRERWVDIVVGGSRYSVDPEASVSKAVGIPIHREGCIVSMAAGLLAAGHTVLMGSPTSRPYPFRPSLFPPKLVYKFFGLAWIRGEWSILERQLGYVRSEHRFYVLEYTARCYLDRPWIDRIAIQLP